MKIKYDFVIEEVVGKKIAVIVGDYSGNRFIALNDSAAYIMNLLKEEISAQEIIALIKNNFLVDDIDAVKQTVDSFLSELKRMELLEFRC